MRFWNCVERALSRRIYAINIYVVAMAQAACRRDLLNRKRILARIYVRSLRGRRRRRRGYGMFAGSVVENFNSVVGAVVDWVVVALSGSYLKL